MGNVTLSDDLVQDVLRAAHARPRGFKEGLLYLLTREIVIPIPHLAMGVAVLGVAAVVYWNQTFALNEQLLAIYQLFEISCTETGCVERFL